MRGILSFFLTDFLSVLAGFSIIRYSPEISPLILALVLAFFLNFYRLATAILMERLGVVNHDRTFAWIIFIVLDMFVLIGITYLIPGATTLNVGQAAILRMTYLGVLAFNYLNEINYMRDMLHQIAREMVEDTTGE